MEIVDTILNTNTAELIAYLRGGGDPNFSEDDSGVTLLHHAVSVGNVELVSVLLDWGADPQQSDRILQESPFALAADLPLTRATVLILTHIPRPLQ